MLLFFYFATRGFSFATRKNTLNKISIWSCLLIGYPLFLIFQRSMEDIKLKWCIYNSSKIVSEYDQEIPQSQTTDNPVAPRGRAAQPSRDTRKTN